MPLPQKTVLGLSIAVILLYLLSYITLIQGAIKYLHLGFYTIVFGYIYWIYSSQNTSFEINGQKLTNLFNYTHLCLTLFLFFLQIMKINIPIISSIGNFLLLYLFTGFTFLRCFRFSYHISISERLVLGFLISFGINGAFWFITFPFASEITFYGIYLFNFATSITYIIVHRSTPRKPTNSTKMSSVEINLKTLAGGLLIILFYLLNYCILYPDFAQFPSDMARHYNYTKILIRNPENYQFFNYLFYHISQGLFLSTADLSIIEVQSSLFFLNLMFPLGFFCFIRRYHPRSSSQFPILATLIFSLLNSGIGNLGYLLLLLYRFIGSYNGQLVLYENASTFTQNAPFYSVNYLWMIPYFVNTIALFGFLIVLLNRKLSVNSKLGLISGLVPTIFLIHFAEGVIFGIFFPILGFVLHNLKKFDRTHLKPFIFPFSIGGGLTLLIFLVLDRVLQLYYFNLDFQHTMSFLLVIVIPLLLYGVDLLIHSPYMQKWASYRKIQSRLLRLRFGENRVVTFRTLKIGLVMYFLGALCVKFLWPLDVHFLFVHGIIPWYDYTLWGVNFLFLYLGIKVFLKSNKSEKNKLVKHQAKEIKSKEIPSPEIPSPEIPSPENPSPENPSPENLSPEYSSPQNISQANSSKANTSKVNIPSLSLIALSIILIFLIFGMGLSWINAFIFETSYYEKRMLPFIGIGVVIFSAFYLHHVFRQSLQSSQRKALVLLIFIGLNFPIYSVNADYWKIKANYRDQIEEADWAAISFLNTRLDHDPDAWVITFTPESLNALSLIGSNGLAANLRVHNYLHNPASIYQIFSGNTRQSHPYVYLAPRDAEILAAQNLTFFRTILELFDPLYTENGISIYNLTTFSPPRPTAPTGLIVSSSLTSSPLTDNYGKLNAFEDLFGYVLLGLHPYDYSVIHALDTRRWHSDRLILTHDLGTANTTDTDYDEYTYLAPTNSTQSLTDYLDFISSGNDVFLFNLDGYGNFSNYLFSQAGIYNYSQFNFNYDSLDLTSPDATILTQNLTAPTIETYELLPNHSNTTILANYSSPDRNHQTPFLSITPIGAGSIHYINLFPVLSHFEPIPTQNFMDPDSFFISFLQAYFSSQVSDLLYTYLSAFISPYSPAPETDTTNYGWVQQITATNVTMTAESILLPQFPLPGSIAVIYQNMTTQTFPNHTLQEYTFPTSVNCHLTNTQIATGDNFYTHFSDVHDLNLQFPKDDSASLIFTSPLNQTVTVGHESVIQAIQITFPNPEYNFYARSPSIRTGQCQYSNISTFGQFGDFTPTVGSSYNASHSSSFDIYLADEFLLLLNITLSPPTASQPLLDADQIHYLLSSLLGVLILCGVIPLGIRIFSKIKQKVCKSKAPYS